MNYTALSAQNATSTANAALEYAALGWPVFPIVPGGKRPATPHGLRDATTNEAMIRHWWSAVPRLNVGIACGWRSIDVLDVDCHEDGNGWPALRIARKAGLVNGAQALIRTPSGGAHLWFAGTDQRNGRLRNHHLDFRSEGGYVLTPPSVVDGRSYEFVDRRDADERCDWSAIKRLLEPPGPPRAPYGAGTDATRLAAWVAGLPEGQRNCGAYWAMCRAAEVGADLEPIIAAAMSTGLAEHDVRASAASARRTVATR